MANPFTPTFGMVPTIYLPSQISAKAIADQLMERPQYPDTYLISGVRGSGKTALMMRIRELVTASSKKCIPIELIHAHDQDLVTQLAELLQVALSSSPSRLLSRITSVSVGGVGFSRSSTEKTDDQLRVRALLKRAKQHGQFILLTIDEVSNTAAIRNFVAAYNVWHNLNLPLKIIMTGLPENVLAVQEADNLTFFLRATEVITSPLKEVDMATAYAKTLNIPFERGLKMAHLVEGYSFGFQLLGDLAYRMAEQDAPIDDDFLTQILPSFKKLLFRQAYQTIYKTGSDRDRQYLRAINGRKKTSEVMEIMDASKNVVAKCRQRALERKLVQKDGYGYVVYSLPYFDEFIQQVTDEEEGFI